MLSGLFFHHSETPKPYSQIIGYTYKTSTYRAITAPQIKQEVDTCQLIFHPNVSRVIQLSRGGFKYKKTIFKK